MFAAFFVVSTIIILFLYLKKRKSNSRLLKSIKEQKRIEETLKIKQSELNDYKNNLERLVAERTKELESEIDKRKHTESDLVVAKERAEAVNKAKSIFLANMSHELRTPLVGILGYSDLLSKTLDNDYKEMAEGINRTGNRLLNTLSMILDLARVESDKIEITITNVDISNELKGIYQNFYHIISKKGLDFKLKLCCEKIILKTDKGMFNAIMDNLINNALKFTEKGKIIIKTEIKELSGRKNLIIKVIDTGIGIEEEKISLIFDEFKQLSEGTVKEYPGSGLGLSITKKYVMLLNGIITVESTYGIGTTFVIKFPVEQ